MNKMLVTNNLWFIFECDIWFWIYLYLWNVWPSILCLYLCESTWSVFVCGYFLCLCKHFLVILWDISDRMYLVWVVMHLLMGTICAGGRLSPSSSLTPTNFTRSNCLDFFMIFLATDNPEKFLYSGTLTNNPKTSVVSFSSHFSGQSWQIAVARPPCTHPLTRSTGPRPPLLSLLIRTRITAARNMISVSVCF